MDLTLSDDETMEPLATSSQKMDTSQSTSMCSATPKTPKHDVKPKSVRPRKPVTVSQDHVDAMFQCRLTEGTKREMRLTEAVARFICKGAFPIYIVEKEAFAELLNAFEPRSVKIVHCI